MKVIDAKAWTHEFTCYACKTHAEAEAHDICVGKFGSMGDYDTEYYVECPSCGTTIKISDHKIPERIREGAKKR